MHTKHLSSPVNTADRRKFAMVTWSDVQARADHEKIIVPVNQVRIAIWPPLTTIRYLATAALNSCTGVVIVSPEAGILAHIAPLPPGTTQQHLNQNPNVANVNARSLLQAVANLYQANRSMFATSQTYVVAGIFGDRPAMPDVIRMINQFFANLRLPVIWKSYPVVIGRRPEGYSSIVVHAERPGTMAVVYVNGSRA